MDCARAGLEIFLQRRFFVGNEILKALFLSLSRERKPILLVLGFHLVSLK